MTPDEERFLAEFENCTLAAAHWSHRAHVYMAWLQLRRAPLETALIRIRAGIRRYNSEVLDRSLQYHDTVTVAYTRLIAAAMMDGESFETFCGRNPGLLSKCPILADYYSAECLASENARAGFVEPDRKPLP
ncbi:MAG: hypothetical protein OES99_04640 [Gammaproteobacteria bacterium]|nr:hypothetical protein [Gammaproteobacteria bacterium]